MDNQHHPHRRVFIKKSALATVGLGLGLHASSQAFDPVKPKNKLPQWRGWNCRAGIGGFGFGPKLPGIFSGSHIPP